MNTEKATLAQNNFRTVTFLKKIKTNSMQKYLM